MDKNELLNKIKNTYFYVRKEQDAKKILKDFQSRSKSLESQVDAIDSQIMNLLKLQTSIESINLKPRLIKPNVQKISKVPSYIIGFICFAIISVGGGHIADSISKAKNPGALDTDAPASVSFQILLGGLVIGIIVGIIFYNVEKRKKYQQMYREYNDPERERVQEANKSLKGQVININKKMAELRNDKNRLNSIKSDIDFDMIPNAEQNIASLKENESDLIKVPAKHKDNPNYYLALYEIVDTEQAKELGDAIRIAEDRFQQAELHKELRAQLVASQKSIESTIRQAVNTTNQKLEQINGSIGKLNDSFQQMNDNIQEINSSINNMNRDIINQGEALQSQLAMFNANSSQINNQLQGLQETANYISKLNER